ncbi:MAG: 4Fe-4S dicluster domain-containing protein [Colwellia sp.]
MLREIIEIDENLCDGCGHCIPACHEGALQIIDDKARLISDLMCDGLGECIGHCPTGAMNVIKREATPYDERKVMENIIQGGTNVIKAHLEHMLEHQEIDYYNIALQVLSEKNLLVPEHKNSAVKSLNKNNRPAHSNHDGQCAGEKESNKKNDSAVNEKLENSKVIAESELSHWPIQLHLINPTSPTFNQADVLLAADCSAFAAGDFHTRYLAGKKLLIACPKLDHNQEAYLEKLSMLIRFGQLKSLTILRMEVPCCGGIAKWVKTAMSKSSKSLKLSEITINKAGVVVNTQ